MTVSCVYPVPIADGKPHHPCDQTRRRDRRLAAIRARVPGQALSSSFRQRRLDRKEKTEEPDLQHGCPGKTPRLPKPGRSM